MVSKSGQMAQSKPKQRQKNKGEAHKNNPRTKLAWGFVKKTNVKKEQFKKNLMGVDEQNG